MSEKEVFPTFEKPTVPYRFGPAANETARGARERCDLSDQSHLSLACCFIGEASKTLGDAAFNPEPRSPHGLGGPQFGRCFGAASDSIEQAHWKDAI